MDPVSAALPQKSSKNLRCNFGAGKLARLQEGRGQEAEARVRAVHLRHEWWHVGPRNAVQQQGSPIPCHEGRQVRQVVVPTLGRHQHYHQLCCRNHQINQTKRINLIFYHMYYFLK